MEEVKPESWKLTLTNVPNFRSQLWNPTRRLAMQLREKIQQPYAHTVRFLHNEMSLTGQYLYYYRNLYCTFLETFLTYVESIAGESITKLIDMDNLVQFYLPEIE